MPLLSNSCIARLSVQEDHCDKGLTAGELAGRHITKFEARIILFYDMTLCGHSVTLTTSYRSLPPCKNNNSGQLQAQSDCSTLKDVEACHVQLRTLHRHLWASRLEVESTQPINSSVPNPQRLSTKFCLVKNLIPISWKMIIYMIINKNNQYIRGYNPIECLAPLQCFKAPGLLWTLAGDAWIILTRKLTKWGNYVALSMRCAESFSWCIYIYIYIYMICRITRQSVDHSVASQLLLCTHCFVCWHKIGSRPLR